MSTTWTFLVFTLCMIGSFAARRRAQQPGPEQRRYAVLSLLLSILALLAVLSSAWRMVQDHRRPAPAGVEATTTLR